MYEGINLLSEEASALLTSTVDNHRARAKFISFFVFSFEENRKKNMAAIHMNEIKHCCRCSCFVTLAMFVFLAKKCPLYVSCIPRTSFYDRKQI